MYWGDYMGGINRFGSGGMRRATQGVNDGLTNEIQRLRGQIGFGSPAPAVYGELDYIYNAESELLNFTEGLLDAATVQTQLENLYGAGNVAVALIDGGYRFTFRNDLAEMGVDEFTIDESDLYLFNDGTGAVQPTKASQRNYTAEVSEVKELFTVTISSGDTETATLSNGASITYDAGGLISAISSHPTGFTLSGGGVGSGTATWTQDSPSAITDPTVTSGPGSVSVDTQGADPVMGVPEQFQLSVSGNGDVTTSSGIVVTVIGDLISNISSGATGYSPIGGGGVGNSFVIFVADANGAKTDETISSDTTGGSSSIFTTVQGSDDVPGTAEVFTYTTGGAISRTLAINNAVEFRSVFWTGGLITSYDTPTGFTAVDGGVGETTVQFEQITGGPANDYTVTSGSGSVSYQQASGVAFVAEVLGNVVINRSWDITYAGWLEFTDGFTIIIPLPIGVTGDDIKTALNGADGYNDTVIDSVDLTDTTITITYAVTEQPTGTVSIDGRVGEAVTMAIATLQEGGL